MAEFSYPGKENENKAPIARFHMRYSGTVINVLEDMEWQVYGYEIIDRLDSTVKNVKKQLMETFGERCDTRLLTVKHHLGDRLTEDIRIFGTLSALDSSLCEHFNLHIRHEYQTTLQRRRTKTMETVSMMGSIYE